jgi:DUF438 domain-containing protein
MSTMRWDDYLVGEHELIERAMAVFKVELEKLPAGKPDGFRLARAIDFLLEFGDKLHNQKEEQHLFPLMEQRGIPPMGPIRVMLMEHEAERTLLAGMLARIPTLASADAAARAAFRREGQDYLAVRSEHIWKENDVLYAMGRQVFRPDDSDALVTAFQVLDLATYGDHARDHYRAMVDELEAGSGARKPLINSLTYEQLDALFEALPVEVTFVDANDQVAYFNRLDKEKIFVRSRSVVGRKVQKCHPAKSVDTVTAIVQAFKDGTKSEASFWIDFKGEKVLIRYFPVRSEAGEYLGTVEVTQAIGAIQALTGQKRLLDWE